MSFTAQLDNNVAAAAEEAANRQGGGGDFPPLPKGRYIATVTENKGVEDFAKAGSPNAGKQAVRLRVDIDPQSPTGAKRVLFIRIPIFSRFAPSQKNPEGAVAWMFFSFFEKVMGVPREDIIAGKPLPSDVEGRRLTVILGDPKKPDAFNPLGSNDVSDVDAPDEDFSRTPILREGQSVAPWLTPAGELIPDHPSLGAPAQRQGAHAPLAQPAWGVPAGGSVPANVTPMPAPTWGNPPTTDPALQQAATSGRSF